MTEEQDDKRPLWLAPASGGSGRSLRLPRADDPLPRIDDRLAPPETRVEYLHGGELYAAPADPPHATEHCELSYVLRAHIADGYRGAVDMLTRTGPGTDIAPDASVFASAPDPATGGRQLEEIAFEVTSMQALSVPTEKARELIQRGVRRVFCILVKQHRVLEWSRRTDGWATLPKNATIEDRCLVRPLPVIALLDASAADSATAAALLDKQVPAIKRALQESRAKGRTAGKREGKKEGKKEGQKEGRKEGKKEGRSAGRSEALAASVITVLEARGLRVSAAVRRRITSTTDVATLDRWLRQAVIVVSADEIFA